MNLFKRLFVTTSLVATLGATTYAQEAVDNRPLEVAKRLEIFNELYRELELFYVDTLDTKATMGVAIEQMLSSLDPYTEFYGEDNQDDLKMLSTGKYAGIGAVIRYHKGAKRVAVGEPIEGTPAALAGMRVGDVIVRVDGKKFAPYEGSAVATYTADVRSMLLGEAGTSLEVEVQRAGESKTRTFHLTRQNIKKPAIACTQLLDKGVGYVMLADYTEQVASQVRQAVVALKEQGATRLVLDLRGNGGGLLSEAVKIVNLFLPRGKEVVRIDGKVAELKRTYATEGEPLDLTIPVAVLVDGYTASAAEITSGALQDYDRAVVVGTRTFGKGLVQQLRDLPYGTAVKLTTSKYYIPSGRCVQKFDYKQRSSDGSATTIATDSTATLFYTAAGRPVRDAGGILPDIVIESDTSTTLLAALASSDALADFVASYRQQHESIAPPAEFSITEADFEAFKQALVAEGFTYDQRSRSFLDALRRMMVFEGYATEAQTELDALEQKLKHDVARDLDRQRQGVTRLLNSEICRAYYYERGALTNLLTWDKVLQRAISVLTEGQEYTHTLATPHKAK